ncbi:MAG TPA: response regulator [Candidatus Binatia bacterium]|nr:response regulator [Candidatus Binatia bacterium]
MPKKILVVEDYADSRSMLAYLLQSLGYETTEAASGTQALERAVSDKPHLILMDVALPGMTGIDAAKALKQNSTTAHIPIIAYSALGSRQWREKALDAGMVEYLAKPVSVDLIKQTIEKHILP